MALTLGVNSGFVTVAPTADPNETGETIDGSSVVTKHTSPAGATKITSIGWYRASGTNAANWEIALYSEAAGIAATRLFVDATNSTTSNGWVVTAVDWAISGSTAYWLGLQMDAHSGSSSVDGAAAGGAGSDVLASQTTLNDPYGGGAVADADGMYAIYALVKITHPTSGALTGAGSTVAGNASSKTTRASTGALTGAGSVVVGSADREDAPVNVTHETTGVLTGPGSTVVGSSSSATTRTSTGVLTGPGSTVVGSAARFRELSTSGILVGAGSTVAGDAARVGAPVTHETTGDIVGASSIIVGSATLTSSVPAYEQPISGSGWGKRRGKMPRYWWQKDPEEIPEDLELPEAIEELEEEEQQLAEFILDLETDEFNDKVLHIMRLYAEILKDQAEMKRASVKMQEEARVEKKKSNRKKAIAILLH